MLIFSFSNPHVDSSVGTYLSFHSFLNNPKEFNSNSFSSVQRNESLSKRKGIIAFNRLQLTRKGDCGSFAHAGLLINALLD
jgi:hypothetical protein